MKVACGEVGAESDAALPAGRVNVHWIVTGDSYWMPPTETVEPTSTTLWGQNASTPTGPHPSWGRGVLLLVLLTGSRAAAAAAGSGSIPPPPQPPRMLAITSGYNATRKRCMLAAWY